MPKIRAGIVNVTGYIGAELARLLSQHPQVKLVTVTGRSAAGRRLGEVFPSFTGTGHRIEAELKGKTTLPSVQCLVQAVQNMNLMFNLPETTGPEALAIYP
jgi:N-acetyl-gamma-glutamylphosphate reductase